MSQIIGGNKEHEADPSLEYTEPDESRPAKRVRLDGALDVTEELQDEVVDDDDWDDIYGALESKAEVVGAKPTLDEIETAPNPVLTDDEQDGGQAVLDEVQADGGAGLVVKAAPHVGTLPVAPNGERAEEVTEVEKTAEVTLDGVPAEAVVDDEPLMDERIHVNAIDEPSVRMVEEVSGVNGEPNAIIGGAAGQTNGDGELVQQVDASDVAGNKSEQPVQGTLDELIDELHNKPAVSKATEDPDFMAAAAAQKEDAKAEWNFDPSDAESGSDDDSSDSSSDDSDAESEDGYEMMDAATAAKLLMAEEGGDDDEGKKKGGDRQPRTQNEQKEHVVPKPDVVVTEEMKITELGAVERAVENMILIKGFTPGEYQVLESGSVLCNEKRKVLGVVAEALGRVQEPMYSVAFTNAKDIEDAGLVHGVKVYYVDSHSTFVFTQPLKNMKGTDASNLHDEEIGEDEMEFSDDEAEAEHKRAKKQAKKAGRGGLGGAGRGGHSGDDGPRSFGAPGHDAGETFIHPAADAPQQNYGGALSYDDEPADEFYSPLKRPDNLSQMMASGGAPLPPRPHGGFDRGRGRGRGDRGRGRGDRGRGRGGFNNDRGGRGAFQKDRDQRGGGRGGRGGKHEHRGNAQSFPDRHNSDSHHDNSPAHALPNKPRVPQGASPPAQTAPPQQQQYPQQYPPYPQQAQQPQSYQFNGYTFQYGNAPPQPQQQQQHNYNYAQQQHQHQHQQQGYQQPPTAAVPPSGAYVNPAFYQNQQLPQQQAGYGGAWAVQQGQQAQQYAQQHQHNASATGGAPTPQQQANLAELLRRIGGQGQ
ncbi:hypothetical protein LTR78_007926 [Recurvomyces mirabilis]|uniref:H/ACA ribonucleoprotein complex non-core subunit NAF1 n=1 Tax=Recurvomyces mirabilis TaxID=574656 RepID=A0AAE0TQZ8_9PEZI|nr:hypothetical protein LTR78_007926 [Recurvomyces mirabilis]KAK5152461.1 hypothetical protein LTS14_008408 [Recurvomyces mirabilis]